MTAGLVLGERLRLEWAVAFRALPGESETGDAHLVEPFPGGTLLAVVDGLGHGRAATEAAQFAIEVLRERPSESVISLIDSCHQRLRHTRGVVMSLVSLREADSTLTWIGVGNVEGMLQRQGVSQSYPSHEHILLRPGVVGYQLSSLRAVVLPVLPGDLLLLATDGIDRSFKDDVPPHLSTQACADRILTRHVKPTDDALVLVARILGGPGEPRVD